MSKINADKYKNPYGTWIVTTEGDCEGKTVKDLGTYVGYIDEIAFGLANECTYTLEFSPVIWSKVLPKSIAKSVNITFGIDSGTWPIDSSREERLKFFREVFKNRDVDVEDCNYYASVTLTRHVDEKEIEEEVKRNALAKLTDEEKRLLGL